jgi:hypothetical protein
MLHFETKGNACPCKVFDPSKIFLSPVKLSTFKRLCLNIKETYHPHKMVALAITEYFSNSSPSYPIVSKKGKEENGGWRGEETFSQKMHHNFCTKAPKLSILECYMFRAVLSSKTAHLTHTNAKIIMLCICFLTCLNYVC